MLNLNSSPELRLKQANERVETLHKEAVIHRLTKGQSLQKVVRKKVADSLVRVARWLEPTLQTSSLDDISPNLSKH